MDAKKTPLTDKQMALVFAGAILLAAPQFFLLFRYNTIWPSVLVLVASQVFLFFRRRKTNGVGK